MNKKITTKNPNQKEIDRDERRLLRLEARKDRNWEKTMEKKMGWNK